MIRLTPLSPHEVQDFCERYHCNPILAELLIRKKITDPSEVLFFLEQEHLHYTHNPFLLPDIEIALRIIRDLSQKGGSAMVFGDKDVDGVTSTALLVNFLESCGITAHYRVPEGQDRYGLSMSAVSDVIKKEIDVIFAVDCGSTQLEEIAYADKNGIPVVVIDHHELRDTFPKAKAIVNPKRNDSNYPCTETCACTLIAKLIFAYHLFASPSFMQEIFLLHSIPGQDVHICDGYRLRAGVIQERLHGTSSKASIDACIENAYYRAETVIVYNKKSQHALLKQLEKKHGKKPLLFLQEGLSESIPQLKQMSISELREHSHARRYADIFEEIDMLYVLFRYFIYACEKDALGHFISCLDLVAMATMADLVKTTNENRILLNKGLAILVKEQRPILPLLVKAKLLEYPLDAQRIPWTLIPTLNATGRMGKASIAVRLFLEATSLTEKETALRDAIKLNERRKALCESAMREYQGHASKSLQELQEKCILITGTSIPRGITGIIANRIAEQYQKPCICIAIEDTICVGSVRSIGMLNTPEFLAHFSEWLLAWGGHHNAGGFSLHTEKLLQLTKEMSEYIRNKIYLKTDEEDSKPDCLLNSKYLTPDILTILDDCKPFGQGFRVPRFQIDGMKILEVRRRGSRNQHFLLLLEGGGFKWPAVYWDASPELEHLFTFGNRISISCAVALNVFKGRKKIQLEIHDLE